jgi:hypothetical protein
MDLSPAAEAAVARWIEGGVTSLTHPVLAQLFRDCFAPLGIEADWLEAEPFSSLEAGWPDGWLRLPRWNPARLDPHHPAAIDLQHWALEQAQADQTADRDGSAVEPAAIVTVQPDGLFRLPESTDERAAWAAVRHSVAARERVRVFLAAAAASLLFDAEAAAIYRDGDAAEFVRRIWAQMEEPTDRTADGAANIPEPAATAPVMVGARPLANPE